MGGSGEYGEHGPLSRADISSPTFYVPDAVDETTDYEYLLTVSTENAADASAEVVVTVLNKETLAVVCMDPGSAYEGSEDFAFDCAASGAPAGSGYAYVWMAQGDTQNTLQLSATDIPSPTFYVPDAVDETTGYEYLLTVSTENAADASAEVVVTVLNKETLAVVCMDPGSAYEGSEDFAFNCTASGAPGGSEYTYVWMAQGQYGEHGPLEQGGHFFADLLRAGRRRHDDNVQVPFNGERGQCGRRFGRGYGDGA